jgi:hypothetical protein
VRNGNSSVFLRVSGLLTRFPRLVSLVSTLVFFGLTFIVFAAFMLPIMALRPIEEGIRTETSATPIDLEERVRLSLRADEADEGDIGGEDEKPPRRLRRSRRSRSRSTDETLVGIVFLPSTI